jgi:D-alanyl-D-alanine carboxypeptidase
VKHLVLIGFAAILLAAACGSQSSTPAAEPSTSAAPPLSTSTEPETKPAPPRFRGAIAVINAEARARMSSSWRPGCPVPLEDLRLLTVKHWGFDRALHQGELVVHRDQARAVLRVLPRLFKARFPIERMRLVDEYGGDDERSMAANNTSAFNCRGVPGSGSWSEHAYGRAIDINPLQNPEVRDGKVSPAAGADYVDRSRTAPGMIRAGDVVVRAFASIGWGWGGYWHSLRDYQHFSSTGR